MKGLTLIAMNTIALIAIGMVLVMVMERGSKHLDRNDRRKRERGKDRETERGLDYREAKK